MNPEWKLLCKILQDNDLTKVRLVNIDKSYFKDVKLITVWNFIEQHFEDYRVVPSVATVEQKFDLKIDPVAEPIEYWISEVQNQKIEEEIVDVGQSINGFLTKGEPRKALEFLVDFSRGSLVKFHSGTKKATTARDLAAKVWTAYEDAKAGKMGFPTPWVTMNEWTMGWFKKDISFFVARSGVGKSFLLIDLAQAVVSAGHSVLFISCEMSADDIAQRYFAGNFKINYGGIRKGKLGYMDEQNYKASLENYTATNDLEIYDGSMGLHMNDVEMAILNSKAEFVIIDSCYRITARQKSKDRFDNMAYVVTDLKMLAQLHDRAIVASTQLNREFKKKKKDEALDLTDIALSDVISWTSTNVFAMSKHEDNDTKKVSMRVYPLKIREGENQKKFMELNWDFIRMDFSEVSSTAKSIPANYTDPDKDDDAYPW